MKTSNDIFLQDASVIKRTQSFWKDKYGEEISEENARKINERITRFFRLLHKWNTTSEASDCNLGQNGNTNVS